jgi:hypothetical protein
MPASTNCLAPNVLVKHENHQPVGAFKVRGGVNLVAQLSADERGRGVIAASTGNHGHGRNGPAACGNVARLRVRRMRHSDCGRIDSGRVRAFTECSGQVRTRPDGELAVGTAEVVLDRPDGDEQGQGDSRLLIPLAAIRAIRASLGVNASGPEHTVRRGRAPATRSSSTARRQAHGAAALGLLETLPQQVSRRTRWAARRSAAPSSTSVRARSGPRSGWSSARNDSQQRAEPSTPNTRGAS